ncbi:hypothetical protein [Coleofasciculus sp. FACHB-542]|uniref:hypothetical protein n=1 Tax=Coleofasciculus sp. FACHB-542 TaxID=2692787 RepID=UPI001688F48E|nr:hypothetical protein [Coleofasciculus sp. FACHB-542]MBD2085082.1 hypothetical protein [Coleofasciculus sp. FACHB-542]
MSECRVCLNLPQAGVKLCPVCNWDLSIYPLSPDGLKQEQESRISWSKEVWEELILLREKQWLYELLLEEFQDLARDLAVELAKERVEELETELSQKLDLLNNKYSQKLDKVSKENEALQNEVNESKESRRKKNISIDSSCKDYADSIGKNYYINLPKTIGEGIESCTKKKSQGTDGQAYWFRRAIIHYVVVELGWFERGS